MSRVAALLCAVGATASGVHNDYEALVQQSVATHAAPSLESSMIQRLLEAGNATLNHIDSVVREQSKIFKAPGMKKALSDYAKASSSALSPHQDALLQGWQEFRRQAMNSVDTKPEELLHKAKMAMIQTGAMAEMRKVAMKTAAASNASARGAVPLDSMTVGFYTSLAPWNNVLKAFSLPLIKAQFSMFSNFFGPEGNAARLCIGASIAVDSTYSVHSRAEFGGVGVFVGPAKWDNVPGWNFGASGGIDDLRIFDVADFGWGWTLAEVPETVGFNFLIHLIDHEGLAASALQTGAEVFQSGAQAQAQPVKTHGSSWIEHIWCSPDWDNTPLVIVPQSPATTTAVVAALSKSMDVTYDPVDDAV